MAKRAEKIYTVSELSDLIKIALEQSLPSRLTVCGEISGWNHHRSGHCYFDIKDAESVLPCVMWKSSFAKLKFEPENGMAVIARGHVDVYAPHGKYQFYADSMTPQGVGELQIKFEQMVKKLEAEGLFRDEHKKPLPRYPMNIAVVTSESGAAVRDIAESINRRWPIAKLYLFDARVQGEGAAEQIAQAIKSANKKAKLLKLDLLIVGRGGGSMEDLWAFNEEAVVRAVFASGLPVISAVGHEKDISICDLVADKRASTPARAGVIAVPDIDEVAAALESIARQLQADVLSKLNFSGQQLETVLASSVFRNPYYSVNMCTQKLDALETDIAYHSQRTIKEWQYRLGVFEQQIQRLEPTSLIERKKSHLSEIQTKLFLAVEKQKSNLNIRLTSLENRLAGLNPKNVLARGYSLTTNLRDGRVVTNVEDLEIGDEVVTELADKKSFESKVMRKYDKERIFKKEQANGKEKGK